MSLFNITSQITAPILHDIQNDLHFSIQGNIGCGKSTFLQVLREKFPQIIWIEEPVKEWQNIGGKGLNILDKYYSDSKRWGFTFQIYAIFTRIKSLQQACIRFPNSIKISQRSILADKYVFAQIMKDLGFMEYCQYEVYKHLFQHFARESKIDKTKIIYLRCSAQTCYKRTKQRKRQQQSQIPLQYLQKIHQKHQKWFQAYDKEKVLVIDTDQNFKNNQIKIKEFVQKLKEFLYPQKKKQTQKQ